MLRLYLKYKGKFMGFAWWCVRCSSSGHAYAVFDEDFLDDFWRLFARRVGRLCFSRNSKGDRIDVFWRRSVYARLGGGRSRGWVTIGWLLLPKFEIVMKSYFEGDFRHAERLVKQRAAVSCYAFECECGRKFLFDVVRHRLYDLARWSMEVKRNITQRMYVHSVYLKCPKCGTNNKFILDDSEVLMEISCSKCGLKGILDTRKLIAEWGLTETSEKEDIIKCPNCGEDVSLYNVIKSWVLKPKRKNACPIKVRIIECPRCLFKWKLAVRMR